MMNEDEKYMDMALALAREGLGATYPNPMVGCVIVSRGEVIGQGYHHRAGQAHAEVNAIESVRDKTRLRESTLYVTLEPCSHFGKTPPCADRIVREGIPRVVVGVVDPFDQVAGRGIRKLEQAGIAVTLGVREQECRRLNERFFTFHQKKRPYVVLKWAQSADGYLDAQRDSPRQPPQRITGPLAQQYVHRMRSIEQAILVGTRTACLDNPRLDARLAPVPRHPLRVVPDRRGIIPLENHLLDGSLPTLVFTEVERPFPPAVEPVPLDFSTGTVPQMLDALYRRGIQSVLVEGGAEMLASFFRSGLWDRAYVFSAPQRFLGAGVPAPGLPNDACAEAEETLGDDRLVIYRHLPRP